jgi:hypothetical protein
MTATQTDKLVDDYLRRLEAAAAHLQRSRRAELVAEIREHIESALRQEEAANEVAVRNVLERLGPPEEIVEAAEPQPEPSRRRGGALEITALLALLVPVIGWLVGMVLVFVSEAWSRRDKLIGAALLLVLVLVPFVGVTAESGGVDQEPVPVGDTRPVGLKEEESTDTEAILLVTALGMLAGLPSALFLGWRLRRHHHPSVES